MALTPTERIKIITEIATRLSNEEYPLVDLTLKQFSLPWSDTWTGEPRSYVIAMIENASDDQLVSLGQHVGYQFNQPALGIDPPFWRKGMLRMFLSHLSEHKAFAAELQEALAPLGVSCFVAHNDIEPTLEWQTQIETALATCDVLTALLHPKFHESNWTDQEIGFAMGRGVLTLAVGLGQAPYGFIGRFQAFNGNGKSAVVLAHELFNSLRKHKQTNQKMREVLVRLFEESGSFAQSKERIGFLEDLDTWEPSFSSRLATSVNNNSQISSSFGVPARVEALIAKWAKKGV